jgi:hypothetical protein
MKTTDGQSTDERTTGPALVEYNTGIQILTIVCSQLDITTPRGNTLLGHCKSRSRANRQHGLFEQGGKDGMYALNLQSKRKTCVDAAS